MVLRLLKKKSDDRRKLQSILGNYEIPTFPSVVMRTVDVLRRPDSSAADVAEVLSTDPGLTVRLLKLVNSAGYSPSRPVNDVAQAVAIAGSGTVESLVLSAGVTTALGVRDFNGFDQRRFWQTSSLRATLARKLAIEYHPATAGLSFTAGLLQDMAIPLLATAREDYRPVLAAWHAGAPDLIELELSVFGWAHDQVGQWLCQEWELPESLSDAVAGHHGRSRASIPPAIRLVSSIREVPIEGSVEDVPEDILGRAVTEFGFDADRVRVLYEEAEAEAADLVWIFG